MRLGYNAITGILRGYIMAAKKPKNIETGYDFGMWISDQIAERAKTDPNIKKALEEREAYRKKLDELISEDIETSTETDGID